VSDPGGPADGAVGDAGSPAAPTGNTESPASIFRCADPERRRFVPTEHARGPWDPRALHGGAPAALIAAELERLQPGAELPFARLHFEFLRPVPLAPLELHTRITRPGRRVQALEGELRAGEELVCRARALRIQPAPDELPARAGELVREYEDAPLPAPVEGHEVRFALDDTDLKSFAATAMEMRFLVGRPLKGGLPEVGISSAHAPVGAATVWMRLRYPLLPGEPLTPLARVPAAADFGNGVAAVLPFDEYLFINADLSIELDRRPAGEWTALRARTLLHPGGIGWAESVLHDARGPLGVARQSLVVQRR
jgi:acyl-coenzyme A thioesterase PaaI-like protein